MKRFAKMLMVAGLAAAAAPAAAAMDLTQGARVGAGVGSYTGEANVEGFNGSGALVTADHQKDTRATYGGELGYTINLSDFYADLGLNILNVEFQGDNLWRTDLLFTLGYYLTDKWSLFAGVRRGWQGDGIFKDDAFREFGPYAGLGFGGIPLGGWGTLNLSAAYNFDKVKDFPPGVGKDLDYPGVSLKIGMNFKNTPHSIQLRLQRFSGDDNVDAGPSCGAPVCRVDYDLAETWAVLSYVFTLAW